MKQIMFPESYGPFTSLYKYVIVFLSLFDIVINCCNAGVMQEFSPLNPLKVISYDDCLYCTDYCNIYSTLPYHQNILVSIVIFLYSYR